MAEVIGNISYEENATSPSTTDTGAMEKGFKTLAYGLIVFFSVIGNSLIIAAFKLNPSGKLRTVNNMFIVSMAAADLLMTLGSIPERITRILVNEQWIIGGNAGIFFCRATNFVEKLCVNVTILHLVMIATDRFLVVFYPRRKLITSKRALRMIIVTWFASAGYCVPLFYYANLLKRDGNLICKTRYFFYNWRVWYLIFLSLLLTSLVLVVILYTAIVIQLCRSKTPGERHSLKSRNCTRLNNRVLKMVAMVLLAFYFCFLPYWMGWILCSWWKIICNNTYTFISIFLMYTNSAVNPIIYSFFNEYFRVAFRLIFTNKKQNCRCFKKKRGLPCEARSSDNTSEKISGNTIKRQSISDGKMFNLRKQTGTQV